MGIRILKSTPTERSVLAVVILAAVLMLAGFGAFVYVVIHFVVKYW